MFYSFFFTFAINQIKKMRKLLFITIWTLLITSCGSDSGCIQGDCQNLVPKCEDGSETRENYR